MKKALLVLIVFLALAPAIAAADWPQAKHDAQHTSVGTALTPPLAVDWQASVGGEAVTSPVVYNGTLLVGNGNGRKLIALDLNGRQLWEFSTGGSIESTPAAANGSVVVGSYDGYVYGLDASTGRVKWKYYVQSGIYSSPLIYGGKVYVGTDDGKFYAIGLENGTGLWSVSGATQASPAGDGGKVYVGTLSGVFHAMDAVTGGEAWKYVTNDSFHSSPLIYNGTVFVASRNGTLYAFDLNGSVRWSHGMGYSVDATPSVDPATGTVYLGTYGGRVYAFNATSGDLKWASAFYGPIYQSVAVSGSVLYGATQDGRLFALDRSGAGLWTYDLGSEAFASPAVDGGRLYMATMGGDVLAFKESASATAPRASATAPPASTPFVDAAACALIIITVGLCRRSR